MAFLAESAAYEIAYGSVLLRADLYLAEFAAPNNANLPRFVRINIIRPLPIFLRPEQLGDSVPVDLQLLPCPSLKSGSPKNLGVNRVQDLLCCLGFLLALIIDGRPFKTFPVGSKCRYAFAIGLPFTISFVLSWRRA